MSVLFQQKQVAELLLRQSKQVWVMSHVELRQVQVNLDNFKSSLKLVKSVNVSKGWVCFLFKQIQVKSQINRDNSEVSIEGKCDKSESIKTCPS